MMVVFRIGYFRLRDGWEPARLLVLVPLPKRCRPIQSALSRGCRLSPNVHTLCPFVRHSMKLIGARVWPVYLVRDMIGDIVKSKDYV